MSSAMAKALRAHGTMPFLKSNAEIAHKPENKLNKRIAYEHPQSFKCHNTTITTINSGT
jgi:hypothetical protein